MRITTQKQLREEFWDMFSELECRTGRRGKPSPQNDQPADTRAAFVNWVDQLQRSGDISEALAGRATL